MITKKKCCCKKTCDYAGCTGMPETLYFTGPHGSVPLVFRSTPTWSGWYGLASYPLANGVVKTLAGPPFCSPATNGSGVLDILLTLSCNSAEGYLGGSYTYVSVLFGTYTYVGGGTLLLPSDGRPSITPSFTVPAGCSPVVTKPIATTSTLLCDPFNLVVHFSSFGLPPGTALSAGGTVTL